MREVRLLPGAEKELGSLDRQVAQRVVTKLRWLAEHIEEIRPEGLSGDLAGLCKLRVGDYRVIYQRLEPENVLIFHKVGHRSEVYER